MYVYNVYTHIYIYDTCIYVYFMTCVYVYIYTSGELIIHKAERVSDLRR